MGKIHQHKNINKSSEVSIWIGGIPHKKLREIKGYYGVKSNTEAIRLIITEHHRLLLFRKEPKSTLLENEDGGD